MKRTKNKVETGRPKLLALVKRWKLSQLSIAEEMNMNIHTFKLKLNINQPKYNFTDEEYLEVIGVLRQMDNEIHAFLKNTDLDKTKLKELQKSKILF